MASDLIHIHDAQKHTLSHVFDAACEKENNTVGKHLAEARKALGLSADAVCSHLKNYNIRVQRGAISKWELGITTPNCYQLLALCSILKIDDISDYLLGNSPLNEQGQLKVAEYKADLIATGLYAPHVQEAEITYIRKPVSSLSVSAGVGNILDEGSFEMMDFPVNSVPGEADFAVRITGDSMEPVYSNGQYVWVKKCNDVAIGEVGIFVYDGEGYIKMYSERTPEDADAYTDSNGILHNQPVLVSYNKKYSPIHVSAESGFHVIGRVL